MTRRRRRWLVVAAVTALLVAAGLVDVIYQYDFDIHEARVAIPAGAHALDGVLASPEGGDEPSGLVIFVHGDGPADATHDGFYRPLWESFAKAGYASLSWNKPGVAGTPGNWLDQSMDDRAHEVAAAIAWARSQPEIDTHRIGLWGASQAGWILPKVAARASGLRFVIAVSPAINWLRQGRYNLLAELHAKGASPATIEAEVRRSDKTRDLLRQGATYDEYRAAVGDARDVTAARWAFVSKNYTADAVSDLTALRTPILLILGGHDRNVDIADTETTYRTTLPDPGTLQVRHYPDATHALLDDHIEKSTIRLTLTAIFAPRAIFARGYLADQRRFLQQFGT